MKQQHVGGIHVVLFSRKIFLHLINGTFSSLCPCFQDMGPVSMPSLPLMVGCGVSCTALLILLLIYAAFWRYIHWCKGWICSLNVPKPQRGQMRNKCFSEVDFFIFLFFLGGGGARVTDGKIKLITSQWPQMLLYSVEAVCTPHHTRPSLSPPHPLPVAGTSVRRDPSSW